MSARLARAGRATVFPQAIGLAAMFDPELMHRIAALGAPQPMRTELEVTA